MQATIKVLQHAKGTLGQGLFFLASSNIQFKELANADWATCLDTR